MMNGKEKANRVRPSKRRWLKANPRICISVYCLTFIQAIQDFWLPAFAGSLGFIFIYNPPYNRDISAIRSGQLPAIYVAGIIPK